jgi:hypothetical protein
MATVHELLFLAPIPRGHDLVVLTFGRVPASDGASTVVLDRTASTLYCSEDLYGPLHQDPVLALTDPVAVVTRWAWTLKSTAAGICGGAMIATTGRGGGLSAKTLLLMDPPGTPYR